MKQNELQNKYDSYLNINALYRHKLYQFILFSVKLSSSYNIPFPYHLILSPSPFFHHLFLMPVDYTRNRYNSAENKHYR